MNLWWRLAVVAIAAGVVALVVAFARYRRRPSVSVVEVSSLDPGLYLFTSSECSTCERARERLESFALDFEEISWQRASAVFERVGIDAVPSLLLVSPPGEGRLWRGRVPDRAEIH